MARKRHAQPKPDVAEDIEQDIEEMPMKRERPRTVASAQNAFSCGCTLMNCTATGNPLYHYIKGLMYLWCGASSAGKTWLAKSALAEASRNPAFDDYRLIDDDPEGGSLMDIGYFFGKKLEKRLEGARKDGCASHDYEDFMSNLTAAQDEGTPFIYVLDSMDALTSEAEQENTREIVQAIRKGTKIPGSYGDGKAKKNSSFLRQVNSHLKKTGSILILLAQHRDSLSGMGGKTRSGGHAMKFYNRMEWWGSATGALKKTVNGKERMIGNSSEWTVKKNHITGMYDKVGINIYLDYGMDDISACVEYLVSEGTWSKEKNTIQASHFGVEMVMPKLIRHIEQNDLYNELQALVGETWNTIRDGCAIRRRRRYE